MEEKNNPPFPESSGEEQRQDQGQDALHDVDLQGTGEPVDEKMTTEEYAGHDPEKGADPPHSPGRLSWLALIISLVAVAGLIFLFLTRDSQKPAKSIRPVSVARGAGEAATGTRIAFVRADSVQNNYLMTIHFLDSIEKRFRSMENDLIARKKSYEKKVQEYYKNIQSGLLKESLALQVKETLETEGDEIARLEDTYTERINDLQLKLNIIYFDSLWNFIDRYKADFGVDMVVGYQQGLTNIFFADASLDITDQVIEGINREYAERYPDRKNLKKKK